MGILQLKCNKIKLTYIYTEENRATDRARTAEENKGQEGGERHDCPHLKRHGTERERHRSNLNLHCHNIPPPQPPPNSFSHCLFVLTRMLIFAELLSNKYVFHEKLRIWTSMENFYKIIKYEYCRYCILPVFSR